MRGLNIIVLLLILSCEPSAKTLPILSYTIDENGLKSYYTISYSGFTNHLGQDFSTERIEGKVCVANFFFTRCPSICPPMRNAMITLAEDFYEDENLLFISHTIDPEFDSVSVLKAYADNTEITSNTWQFIRASETETKAQAKLYMTNFKPNEDGTDFYHSSYVALVDKTQQIRGFYNLLSEESKTALKKDIRLLLN